MKPFTLALILSLSACCAAGGWIQERAGAQEATALLLFGGNNHKEFLGCLNCSKSSSVSVCNQYGSYGSKYSDDSIWDEYGTYGSKYSTSSPWDEYSTDAPIIVDKDGNSYGYFSANKYIADRTRIRWLVHILDFQSKVDDLKATHELMCSDDSDD